MDATARFEALVGAPDEVVLRRLDEAALLVAAHVRPELDVAASVAELDAIAASCRGRTIEGVREAVFVTHGFTGNTVDYYDPDNALLDRVLERRTGIPITLAIVTLAVAQRVGVGLTGVGMPGHFLVGVGGTGPAWLAPTTVLLDPFAGGQKRSWTECRALFHRSQGAATRWDPAYLAPVGPRAILRRVLANLAATLPRRGGGDLGWIDRLMTLVPPEQGDERIARAALN